MARRRRQAHELERVLGANALFATAYGNVGSSIYYALGLTAGIALGLTPLVFIISGLIFAATAATYAEGTVRYPEAGGSSSFARHAFNELVSFGAAWAQMLNYVITVAISVIFVPHYLSIFWEPLRTKPWDVIVGIVFTWLLVGLNIVGIQEAAKLNILLAVLDFATQLLLVALGFVLIFSPHMLVGEHPLRHRADVVELRARDPGGDDRVHRHRDRVEPRGGGARPGALDPEARSRWVAVAVFAIYFTLPWIALSAMPVVKEGGKYVTQLGQSPPHGFKNDPVLGLVENLGIHGTLLSRREDLRRHPRRDDPLHRDERGRDRRLAHHVLDGDVPAAAGDLPPPAPEAEDAVALAVVFAGVAPTLFLLSGQVDFLGRMYAFGAMLSFTIAHVAVTALRVQQRDEERPWRARPNLTIRGVDWPLFAIVGGLGTGIAWLVVVVQDAPTRYAGLGWLIAGFVFYPLYRRQARRAAARDGSRAGRDHRRRSSSTGTSSCRSRPATRRTRRWTSRAASRASAARGSSR